MAKVSLTTVANKSKILTKTGFNGYDLCINPYVGCEFECSYCYVRFFVKDKVKPWGEFLRVREHLEKSLLNELQKGFVSFNDGRSPAINSETGLAILDDDGRPTTKPRKTSIAVTEARVVFGTMTDPYQPKETKHRITRKALDILLRDNVPHFKKVGIFTRSPLVLQDLEQITRLPQGRVHFTITPFQHKIMRAIEPFSSTTERRWDTVRKLKEAGVRVHVNVSPIIPGLSEDFIDEWVGKLIELKVDEYFVDPMQPYRESFEAFRVACTGLPGVNWAETEKIMTDKDRYLDWKFEFMNRWNAARIPLQHLAPDQRPIWSDHENRVWVNMITNTQMDKKKYC